MTGMDFDNSSPIARRVRIEGRVQGVGMRPFLYRLAQRMGVHGSVRNLGGAVELHLEGKPSLVGSFIAAIQADAPSFASIQTMAVSETPWQSVSGFCILSSGTESQGVTLIPSDQSVCSECLSDLTDPQNRRYRYPFTHCTQCGPRYTLIERFPLDRENTVMRGFPLCRQCLAEFHDPTNRRYHAQTLCCPECGPQLRYSSERYGFQAEQDPLEQAINLLKAGGILAARGVGGYHLLCDASSDSALATLRTRKHRPDKPFAVMISSRDLSRIPKRWATELNDPARPVVLLPNGWAPDVSAFVAPGLSELGLILPDSPLHFLLSELFSGSLVMTSANISGEPMLIEPQVAEEALLGVADGFLHHDRPILRPAEDAVFRSIGGRLRPIRLGRGNSPRVIDLQVATPGCALALGGDLKSTIALAHDKRVILSPHLGDLVSARSFELLGQVVDDLCRLHGLAPDRVICDAHPQYRSTAWVETLGFPVIKIAHHHAHASAAYEESGCSDPMLVFTFDGMGYGPDGTLWGGEALLGKPGGWQRVAGMRRLKLPGGDRASREPWRLAIAIAWATGHQWALAPPQASLVEQALEKGVNVPETSSVGRLFEAAAALIGVCLTQSYEGQAAMMLEAISRPDAIPVELPLVPEEGLHRWDWGELVPVLMDPRRSAAERGSIFHASIAAAVSAFACQMRQRRGISTIALSGGVFQNNLLTSQILSRLEHRGIRVVIPEQVPLNDAGLSFGQIIEARAIEGSDTFIRQGEGF